MTILDHTMGKALQELNNIMEERHIPPVHLSVIGGFAMMLHGFRSLDGVTDIDYVGTALSREFQDIAGEIGLKYHLGKDWINKDVMLSGISMQDFETITGKLHFKRALTLSKIDIDALVPQDLLRLKIIAIDTSMTAVECGGDFTREKDFPDVCKLADFLQISIPDICNEFSEYIESPLTSKALMFYTQSPDKLLEFISKQQQINTLSTSISNMQENGDIGGLSMIHEMLQNAMDRVKGEE